MADVKEVRRQNLIALVEQLGRSKLAARIETDPNYISQIVGTRSPAQCGDSMARRIEVALHKPRGWMDQPHNDDERGEEDLERMLTTVLQVAEEEGVVLTPRQTARIVMVAREQAASTGRDPDRAHLVAFLQLARGL